MQNISFHKPKKKILLKRQIAKNAHQVKSKKTTINKSANGVKFKKTNTKQNTPRLPPLHLFSFLLKTENFKLHVHIQLTILLYF